MADDATLALDTLVARINKLNKHLEATFNNRRKKRMNYRQVMQLSELIAKKLEIPSHTYYTEEIRTWLVEDPARMLGIALNHDIDIEPREEYIETNGHDNRTLLVYENFKGDKAKAFSHAVACTYAKDHLGKAYSLLKIED